MSDVQQWQIRELRAMRKAFHVSYVNSFMEQDEWFRLRKELDEEVRAIEAGYVYPGGVFDPDKKKRGR